jgi:hypothetical protein
MRPTARSEMRKRAEVGFDAADDVLVLRLHVIRVVFHFGAERSTS